MRCELCGTYVYMDRDAFVRVMLPLPRAGYRQGVADCPRCDYARTPHESRSHGLSKRHDECTSPIRCAGIVGTRIARTPCVLPSTAWWGLAVWRRVRPHLAVVRRWLSSCVCVGDKEDGLDRLDVRSTNVRVQRVNDDEINQIAHTHTIPNA